MKRTLWTEGVSGVSGLTTWLVAVLALAAATLPERAEAMTWVADGEAQAVVVTADEPYPIAEYAAQELVYHVELATGVALPIVTESEAGDSARGRIFVGQSDAARAEGIDHEQLGSEHCVLRTVEGDLYIVGNDGEGHPLSLRNSNAGTLWGVYEVLEDTLEVRWLWPGELGIELAERDRVIVGEWDQTLEPHFHRRDIQVPIFFRGGDEVDRFDYRTYGRLRDPQSFGIAYSSDEKLDRYVWDQQIFLRRHRVGRTDDPRPYTRHSFRHWWEEYGDEHPEWFQKLPEGELAEQWRERWGSFWGVWEIPEGGWPDYRGPADPDRPTLTSMCVSNPEFQNEIIARWQEEREENPDATVRIGENDLPALCTCADCRALDAPQPTAEELEAMPRYVGGSPYRPMDVGRRYAIFWKRVHEKAMEIDPDAVVTAFVYINYFVAPEDVELHPNIGLNFVPWGGWWFPRDPREQVWLRDQWHQWRDTGASLVYRPNSILDGGSMPHVYARQIGEELSYFHRHGSMGFGFDTLTGQWAVNGTTLYVLSRFMNEPNMSIEEMLDEYYTAFGPAALQVKAYFDFWETRTTANRAVDGFGGSTHTYARSAHERYPPETFERAGTILEAAEEAAAESANPRHAERVDYLRQGLTHAQKVAELAALMEDDEATDEARRAMLEELVAHRRAIEDLHVANLAYAGRHEVRAWGDEFDFNLRAEEETEDAAD